MIDPMPQVTAGKSKNRISITVPSALAGDVNGDGHVDVEGLLYLVEAFGSVPGDDNCNAACDFDHNDWVDVVDLLMLVENVGMQPATGNSRQRQVRHGWRGQLCRSLPCGDPQKPLPCANREHQQCPPYLQAYTAQELKTPSLRQAQLDETYICLISA